MGTTNNTGVYQLPNGLWAYRFTWRENGKKKNRKGTKDEFGNPLKTKKQAVAARKAALEKEQAPGKPIKKTTVEELYNVYREDGRSGMV